MSPDSSAAAPGTASPRREKLISQLKTLPRPFWMVNIMEMLERLAYYGVRVVIPIYIAQADEPTGLHADRERHHLFLVGGGAISDTDVQRRLRRPLRFQEDYRSFYRY